MATTTTKLQTDPLPVRQVFAVKRRARELGVTPQKYLQRLIEDDLAVSAKARSTSLDQLAAPFRQALAGVSEEELDRRVKAARAGHAPRVSISGRVVVGGSEISVADEGIGVLPEDRERIFEMFSQSRDDDGADGHGMGLAICRSIVEHHGGRIWVEAGPGPGSRFTFFLPGASAR